MAKKKKKELSGAVELQLRSELTNGLTDLAEVTITVPLSNVTKNLHTRMFIKTQLSLPELQNMKQLGQIFKANAYFYNDKYVKNVWYIKKTKVSVSPTEKSMTLTLSPFNESYESEAKTLASLTEQKNKTKSTNTDTNSISNVKLCDNDPYLKDIVQKAIGTKTDPKQMAYAIYDYYNNNHVYSWDSTAVEEDYARGFKSLWEQHGQSCGPGAACLYYMFKCVGLSPKIMNGHKHYWIQMEIDGQMYYCDHAGAEGAQNSRRIGTSTGDSTVWGGANDGSVRME
jgi:hypothetical protein